MTEPTLLTNLQQLLKDDPGDEGNRAVIRMVSMILKEEIALVKKKIVKHTMSLSLNEDETGPLIYRASDIDKIIKELLEKIE